MPPLTPSPPAPPTASASNCSALPRRCICTAGNSWRSPLTLGSP
ncbi:hypothetical protein LINPERPRIM_LOCUS10161 [Linum perenne]